MKLNPDDTVNFKRLVETISQTTGAIVSIRYDDFGNPILEAQDGDQSYRIRGHNQTLCDLVYELAEQMGFEDLD